MTSETKPHHRMAARHPAPSEGETDMRIPGVKTRPRAENSEAGLRRRQAQAARTGSRPPGGEAASDEARGIAAMRAGLAGGFPSRTRAMLLRRLAALAAQGEQAYAMAGPSAARGRAKPSADRRGAGRAHSISGRIGPATRTGLLVLRRLTLRFLSDLEKGWPSSGTPRDGS